MFRRRIQYRIETVTIERFETSKVVRFKDYIINYQDLDGIGMTKFSTLPSVIALASYALGKPTVSSLTVLGETSIGGTIL